MNSSKSRTIFSLATIIIVLTLFNGCNKEEEVKLPTLNTIAISDITTTSAKSGGNVTDAGGGEITSRGVVWSLSQNPTTEQNLGFTLNIPGTGQYSSNITELTRNTTYYVRAYATNKAGIAYGNELEFTTQGEPTAITTAPIASITAISAATGGAIADDGGSPITNRGIVWNISPNPTIETNQGSSSNGSGIGDFTSELTSLDPNTKYYVRAFATNSLGTCYGEELNFTTRDGICSIEIYSLNEITINSVKIINSIWGDGGAMITSRGVVWSTSQNPTVETNLGIIPNGTDIGWFEINLTNLIPNTTYYVRAYATNIAGTSYSNENYFETLSGIIDLSTLAVTNITMTTATCGGRITYEDGVETINKGVVWSTSQHPTIDTNQGIINNGPGSGGSQFACNLSNLTPSTTYFLRAFATSVLGTNYGNQVAFTTIRPDGPGGTITDIEGNVYNTIWINGRLWTKENLQTTKYNDGASIYLAIDNSNWANLNWSSSYCWYDQNTYGNIYGALYKGMAVYSDKLCPTGWHVPTRSEWLTLINYIGGSSVAGIKLKAANGWNSGGNGTDDYGFAALPGGFRSYSDGFFSQVGDAGTWWSSSDEGWSPSPPTFSTTAIKMFYNNEGVITEGKPKGEGYSVRCIKD